MRPVSDDELQHAASMLVRSCLKIVSGERLALVGDAECSPVLQAIENAGREAGADVSVLRLDQLRSYSTNHTGERPHKVLPDAVRRAMLSSQASVFLATNSHGETPMRDQLLHIVGACKLRHVHMPGVTPLAFATGLAGDFDAMARAGRALVDRLETAREITSESADGTKLVVRGGRRWVSRFGELGPGASISLPAGSVFTAPESVSGRFAASVVGEFFGAREGLLQEPVVFDIVEGVVMNVTAPSSPELVRDIENMLHVAPNSDHVGLIVIGVNEGIGAATGDVSVDQHRPGLHLVFGDPQGKLTGAPWSARTTFAVCQAKGNVRVDGVVVAEDGRLIPS
ncbi:MAG: hypothetical protein JST00_11605 [Deltaproteobacteria bacterium]|nr:hypothetical protein [Deltaproteobacteria bacterium]